MRPSVFTSWKGKKLPGWAWGLFALGGLFLGLGMNTAGTPARAGSAVQTSAVTGISAPSEIGLSAFDVLIKLGFVIGLIYVSLYLLRRWQTKMTGRATRQLRVIESLSLGPRQTLHLVRVGSQTLLIGATDQTLTQLGTVDLPPDPEPTPEKPAPTFSALLAQALPPAFSPVKVSHDPES